MRKIILICIVLASIYSAKAQDSRFKNYTSFDEKISFLIPKTWALKNEEVEIITYESAEKEHLIPVATLKIRIIHPKDYSTLNDYITKRNAILYSLFDIEERDTKTINNIDYKTYEVRHGKVSKNYKAMFYIALINNRFYMIEADLSVKKFRTYTSIFDTIMNSLEIKAE